MNEEQVRKLPYIIQPVFRKAVAALIANPEMRFNKSELAEKADVSRDALYSYWELLEDDFLETLETKYKFDESCPYVDTEENVLLLQVDDGDLMQVVKPVFRKAFLVLMEEDNLGEEYNLSKLSEEAEVSRDALYNYKPILEKYLLNWVSDRKFVVDQDSEFLDTEERVLKVPVN